MNSGAGTDMFDEHKKFSTNSPPVQEMMLICTESLKSQSNCMICVADDGHVEVEFSLPSVGIESFYASSNLCALYYVERESIFFFSPLFGKWRMCTPDCQWFGMAELSGVFYVFGGMDSQSGVVDSAMKYNIRYCLWEGIAPPPMPVCRSSVVALKGMLYVIGGLDKRGESTDVVQRYDPESDTWTQIAPLPVKQGEFKACSVDARIYICETSANTSPESKTDVCSSVYLYHATTDRWGPCSKFSHAYVSGPVCFKGSMCVLTERLDKERVLEKYDASSDSWTEFATFPGYRPILISGCVLVDQTSSDKPRYLELLPENLVVMTVFRFQDDPNDPMNSMCSSQVLNKLKRQFSLLPQSSHESSKCAILSECRTSVNSMKFMSS